MQGTLRSWSVIVALAAPLSLLSAQEPSKVKALLQQAEAFEQSFAWAKACEAYEAAYRLERSPDIRQRYVHALRRSWQAFRHRDPSYQKDVLKLDYGQALRLYTEVLDKLLDQTIDRRAIDPARLFRKGVEELTLALQDPAFLRQYLADASPGNLFAFRGSLQQALDSTVPLNRQQVLKKVRDLALAAQRQLQLEPTLAVMEFVSGSCYALDDYTAYLTPSQLRELDKSLRGDTLPTSVVYHMETDRVGYLHISCFQNSTLQEVDEALLELNKQNMKALVLDLRGNSGGLFQVAVEVARRFLANGVIVSVQHRDPRLNNLFHARNGDAICVPLVVLVDTDTASSAEVLAGAIKENNRGKLVGQTTFGKGCTQSIVKLPSGPGGLATGALRITVARFFSPEGTAYTDQGVHPHLFLPNTVDGMDHQLEEALAEANRLLVMMSPS